MGDDPARPRRSIIDEEPLARLKALTASAGAWQRHELRHPLSEESGGFIDAVAHMQDPERLREVARQTPFAVVEEMLFVGTEHEIAERMAGYGENGCDHVVIGNLTGIVGGSRRFKKQSSRLTDLRRLLAKA